MKRLIFLAMLLILLVPVGQLMAEPVSFVWSGGVWTDAKLNEAGGGFLSGIKANVDEGKGLSIRTLYHQFNFGHDPAKSIATTALLEYSLGKRYEIYFLVGPEFNMSGAEGTNFIGGAGFSKPIWTGEVIKDKTLNPWTFGVFLEINYADNDFVGGDGYFKVFGGLTFTPDNSKK